jgi:hypothetical protein
MEVKLVLAFLVFARLMMTELRSTTGLKNVSFFNLLISAEGQVSKVAMQVKECSLFPGAYRGIRDLS